MSNERIESGMQPEHELQKQASQEPELEDKQERVQLEQLLLAGMQHQSAPVGFADRVMARVAAEANAGGACTATLPTPRRRLFVLPRRAVESSMTLRRHNPWLAGSIAAALLLAGSLGHQAYLRHERVVANQQFATTLRVEQQTMDHVRAQLAAAGVPMEE